MQRGGGLYQNGEANYGRPTMPLTELIAEVMAKHEVGPLSACFCHDQAHRLSVEGLWEAHWFPSTFSAPAVPLGLWLVSVRYEAGWQRTWRFNVLYTSEATNLTCSCVRFPTYTCILKQQSLLAGHCCRLSRGVCDFRRMHAFSSSSHC